MNVGNLPRAAHQRRDGVNQRGRNDVAYLKQGMVFTVAKRRQFQRSCVHGAGGPEFLRENGMRHVDALQVVAAVCDTKTKAVDGSQEIVER
ncbi:hypothetical protein [Verminephrobacter eiseniae]|uniref:hypothetical protein n=1 Tax=Verminephrobacter eiseniae TaxID=364317 RepID=UPI00223883E0|nr:hypothetical protein [Verminephrobacter eiseniae]